MGLLTPHVTRGSDQRGDTGFVCWGLWTLNGGERADPPSGEQRREPDSESQERLRPTPMLCAAAWGPKANPV